MKSDFQKKWIGKRVRLLRDAWTEDGRFYKTGTVFKCRHASYGRLHLELDGSETIHPAFFLASVIRDVPADRVEIVAE